jgi:hypothetical protein
MWKMEDNFKVKIGGNYYINTPNIVSFRGTPLFTLKRRENDLLLGIDFDIYDKNGARIATVRNGNVVQGNENDYEIKRLADHYIVIERTTERVICDIRKRLEAEVGVELEVAVKLYTPSGFLFEATPTQTNLPGNNVFRKSVFENMHTALAIS